VNQQLVLVFTVQCYSSLLFTETREVNKRIILGTQKLAHSVLGERMGFGEGCFKIAA
jgi:hypothetical protein